MTEIRINSDSEVVIVALAAAGVGYLIGMSAASKRIWSDNTVDLERWR